MFDWYDWWRVLLALVCVSSIVLLGTRFFKFGEGWNAKTRDLRFSLLFWILSGISFAIQGIVLDLPITPTLMFITVAAITTWTGLKRRGAWGGSDSATDTQRARKVSDAGRALRVPRSRRSRRS